MACPTCVDTGESTTFATEWDIRLTDCEWVTENEYAEVRE